MTGITICAMAVYDSRPMTQFLHRRKKQCTGQNQRVSGHSSPNRLCGLFQDQVEVRIKLRLESFSFQVGVAQVVQYFSTDKAKAMPAIDHDAEFYGVIGEKPKSRNLVCHLDLPLCPRTTV